MKTNQYAVCEFYPTGNVFPVRIGITTPDEAESLRQWMKQGFSAAEDWRAIPMHELREHLISDRVELSCFTQEAQAEMRAKIMEATA